MHSTVFFGNKNRRSKSLETILIPYKYFSFYAEFQLQTRKKNYFSLSFSICKMMTFCELVRHNLKLLLKADIFHSHWRKSCRSCYLLNILIANFFLLQCTLQRSTQNTIILDSYCQIRSPEQIHIYFNARKELKT